MQLKKIIAAGAMGAIMIGSTLAFAASDLSQYPAPFVAAGTVNTLVVVGKTAATDDVVGAIDLAARLGGESNTPYTCAGTTAGTAVTGEGKAIATTNTKLYLKDNLRKTGIRYTMTSTELPTVLKSGSVADTDASTTYPYDQYLDTSSYYTIRYEREKSPPTGVAADPVVKLYDNAGSGTVTSPPTTTDYLYRARVVFNKELNITTTVSSGATINIFGNDYTFSSGSTITGTNTPASTDKIVLFGSSNTRVFSGGETVTVTIGGTAYDVTFVGATTATSAVVKVGSTQDTITAGTSKDIGGLTVFANKVWQFSTTDQKQNQAKLGLGAQTLTFQQNQRVYTGTGTPVYIDGTNVQLGISNGKLTIIDVYVGGPKSSYDALKEGNLFTDPVYKTFQLDFQTVTPDLKGTTRDLIAVQPSGDNSLTVTYTDYSGKVATIPYAYNASTTSLSVLADSSGYTMHVKEGAQIKLNEYLVVDAGDYPHIFKLTNLNIDGTSTGSIELTDKFSGTAYTIIMGTANSTTKVFDGQTYYVNGTVSPTSYIQVYWGTGASLTGPGTDLEIYPKIRGKNNEYLVFTNQTNITFPTGQAALNVTLPSGIVNLTLSGAAGGAGFLDNLSFTPYSSSYSVSNITNATGSGALYVGKTATGGVWYNITRASNETITIQLAGQTTTPAGASLAAPALILVEAQEKDGANTYSIVVPSSSTSISGVSKIMAGTPAFTYTSRDTADFVSDSYRTGYVDLYGTYAELFNKNAQYSLNIYYAADQMTTDLYWLGPNGAITASNATTGATVNQAVPIKTSIAKLDTEVSDADKQTKNVILVGGPCVNTLVATLATGGKFDYTCSNWPAENFALVKLVDDAFTTGKTALVVAGTRAGDTRDATTALQQFDVSPYSGKLTGTKVKVVGTAITVA